MVYLQFELLIHHQRRHGLSCYSVSCVPAVPFPNILGPVEPRRLHKDSLVKPLSAIILRTHRQPFPFTRRLIRHLHDIHQFLLIRNRKVNLVVVPRAKIDLDVFVAPEKHDRACVVQLVHCVEVWDSRIVHRVDDGEVLDDGGELEEVLVLGWKLDE
jgi:hypothetical protein